MRSRAQWDLGERERRNADPDTNCLLSVSLTYTVEGGMQTDTHTHMQVKGEEN